MRIYKTADYTEMCHKVASLLSAQVTLKPDSVLGLATGSTPLGVYALLADWFAKGDLDMSAVRTINLDEYVGLPADNEQSYAYYMKKNLFDRVNLLKENINLPRGMCADAAAECRRYDAVIASLGGADIQLLGIGCNGHIGFNEPGLAFETGSHLVKLSNSTREANSRFFDSNPAKVPEYAITMGIMNIMLAQMIVVAISGKNKAEIARRAFYGQVTPEIPASVLQLHSNVVVVGDADALSLI